MFTERSLASRALFPSEYDVGARLWGGLGPVRYALAAEDGRPYSGLTSVPVAEKTLVGRLGFAADRADTLTLGGGLSYLRGTGFHAGEAATKSQLLWSDANQDGLVTLNELEAVSGQAATPSETFARWALGGDLELAVRTPLGQTRIEAEAVMAANLDRGWLPADPVSTGYDLRELGWTVSAVQDVTQHGLVAFRAERYVPNSDLFEARRGDFIPTDTSVLTLSPAVGLRAEGLGRLVLQYDYVVDFLGRDDLGQPIDLPNDQWTLRGQVEF